MLIAFTKLVVHISDNEIILIKSTKNYKKSLKTYNQLHLYENVKGGIILSVLLFFGIFSIGVLSNSFVNAQSAEITDTTKPTLLTPDIADNKKPSKLIPDWLKITANWWKQGLLSDEEFGELVAHLIKDEIIDVEGINADSDDVIVFSSKTSIPSWIKDDAEQWTNNKLSDADFFSGLEFMVKSEIVAIKPLVIIPSRQ